MDIPIKKLLLVSDANFVIREGVNLLFKDISGVQLAYVTTASKGTRDDAYLGVHKKMMRERGLNFEEVDIEGKTEVELGSILQGKDVVFVEGGNTFYLLNAVRESGFGRVVRDFIDRGGVYIGSSAGSYIACPTIEMSTWKKPGEEKDNFGVADLTALNLVPFLVRAHYQPEQKAFLKEKIAQSQYPTRVLRDGQAILVEGEKYTFLGEGEEIIL